MGDSRALRVTEGLLPMLEGPCSGERGKVPLEELVGVLSLSLPPKELLGLTMASMLGGSLTLPRHSFSMSVHDRWWKLNLELFFSGWQSRAVLSLGG